MALDAGHSPERSGAISARGKREYDFNVRLTQELLDALHSAGFTSAFRVNPNGEEIKLTTRTARAHNQTAQLFISVHHDSVQEHYLDTWTHQGESHQFCDQFAGFSIFIHQSSHHSNASRALAQDLGHELIQRGHIPTLHHAEDIEGERRDLLSPQLGIYRFDELAVLRTAQSPALLFEAGVIVNRDSERQLEQYRYRQSLIEALVAAIDRSCVREQHPPVPKQ